MSASRWSRTTTAEEAYRRASGRRHYNFARQGRAWWRQWEIAEWLTRKMHLPKPPRGYQAELARMFGVSRATISRDIKAITAALRKQWQDSRLADVVAQAKREGRLSRYTDLC